MAIVVSESSVAPEPLGTGAQRQRLLTGAHVKETRVLLDRWTLAWRAGSQGLRGD